jgi:hypothetical protein
VEKYRRQNNQKENGHEELDVDIFEELGERYPLREGRIGEEVGEHPAVGETKLVVVKEPAQHPVEEGAEEKEKNQEAQR